MKPPGDAPVLARASRLLRDLVHAVGGRQPGADVEELPDATAAGVNAGADGHFWMVGVRVNPAGMVTFSFAIFAGVGGRNP